VNLLGEHTDYNEGFVLPLALDREVGVTVTRGGSPPDDPYTRGVLAALATPLEAVGVRSDATLPAGAGLGSSAAYEVALLRALDAAFELGLTDRGIAQTAWRAETEFAGVPCGVMDQMAAALGRPGEAMLIDCRTLDVRPVALPEGVEVVVRDSGVRHANATSGYAERRRECEAAARRLGVRSLRDVAPGDPRLAGEPRARHVVEENARVLAFAAALERGDVGEAGRLMSASHASQRDLFEVSVPEVDALAARLEASGAYGARLTGGGFGGSVVALVPARRPAS
jgi:galactokinase